MLAVRLPEDLEARLEHLAATTGRPKFFYVREALAEFIDDLEDLYLSQRRVARARDGAGVTLDALMKKYGLANRVPAGRRQGTREVGPTGRATHPRVPRPMRPDRRRPAIDR